MALEQFRLDGQVAIVTGAGRGVGAGIARVLTEAGATIVGTARTESEIVSSIKGIEDAGTTKGEQVAAAISKLKGFETLIGPIDYAWKQQCNVPAAMPFKILQVQGGKETVLATETPSEVPPITC